MTPVLLDANVLIALTVADHVHHEAAQRWLTSTEAPVATCPITEGSLLRYLMRHGTSAAEAVANLDLIRAEPWHHFWPDDLAYDRELLGGVIGHRQVTDAYLVALARRHGSVVVTLDRGMAAWHPDHVVTIAT